MSSFWLTLKQQWTIKISSPLFSIFSLAAILVGNRDHRTYFWKGAIQEPFHQSLVAIGPVVSEEKIKMWKFTTYNGRMKSDGKNSHGLWPGELKTIYKCFVMLTQKTKDQVTWTPLKTGGELWCSGRISSHESGKDQIVIMTNGTYSWSFVTHIWFVTVNKVMVATVKLLKWWLI